MRLKMTRSKTCGDSKLSEIAWTARCLLIENTVILLMFQVRLLREELQLLQEQGSYVGEVIKPMTKNKVLITMNQRGRFNFRFSSKYILKENLSLISIQKSRSKSWKLPPALLSRATPTCSTKSSPTRWALEFEQLFGQFFFLLWSILFTNLDGSSRLLDDGRKSARFNLRNDWRPGQTDQRNQRSHRASSQASRAFRSARYRPAKGTVFINQKSESINSRVFFFTALLELVKRFWRELWLITLTVLSSEFLDPSSSRNSSVKVLAWSGTVMARKWMNFIHFLFRELFVMAREHSPSIIFMDEIDSIGSSRMESGSGGGDSEVQRTMLELLNQLDGFEPHQNIKVGTVRGFNFLFIFRLLWRQIESTFLTALFFDLDVSTGRSSSQHQTRM